MQSYSLYGQQGRKPLKALNKNHFGSKHKTAFEEVIGQMPMLFGEAEVYALLSCGSGLSDDIEV